MSPPRSIGFVRFSRLNIIQVKDAIFDCLTASCEQGECALGCRFHPSRQLVQRPCSRSAVPSRVKTVGPFTAPLTVTRWPDFTSDTVTCGDCRYDFRYRAVMSSWACNMVLPRTGTRPMRARVTKPLPSTWTVRVKSGTWKMATCRISCEVIL